MNEQKEPNCNNPAEAFVMRPIANWKELATVEENENYKLEIEDYCGWIRPKNNTGQMSEYLSTHTFYGNQHERSSKILQKYGFNVVLANWDA